MIVCLGPHTDRGLQVDYGCVQNERVADVTVGQIFVRKHEISVLLYNSNSTHELSGSDWPTISRSVTRLMYVAMTTLGTAKMLQKVWLTEVFINVPFPYLQSSLLTKLSLVLACTQFLPSDDQRNIKKLLMFPASVKS